MPRDNVPEASGWKAHLALGFERRGGRTVLAHRRHDGPLVVQKPLYPARAFLTTPGAGKWYRSAGPRATQRVSIAVDEGAAVEWLPQETILFEGSRAAISWEAKLRGDARLVAWDIVCFGRAASGERFSGGTLRSAARVTRDGKPQWIERARVEPGGAFIESPAGLDGCSVMGTMVVAAPAINDAWLATARAAAPREGEAAATRLPGVLLARYRGRSSEAAREHFAAIWRELRESVMECAAIEPRIWRT